jgi:hypothetical protein
MKRYESVFKKEGKSLVKESTKTIQEVYEEIEFEYPSQVVLNIQIPNGGGNGINVKFIPGSGKKILRGNKVTLIGGGNGIYTDINDVVWQESDWVFKSRSMTYTFSIS